MKLRFLKRFEQLMLYTGVILIGILLDQLTKWLAVRFLLPIDTCPIINDVLHLTYAENRGAAFGILSNDRWVFMLFSSVMIVALLVYLFYPKKQATQLFSVGVAMVVSGGIGNMIDRVVLGYVVDFLNFELINFAIFNVADSFVCVGAGLMVLSLILEIIKEAKDKKI